MFNQLVHQRSSMLDDCALQFFSLSLSWPSLSTHSTFLSGRTLSVLTTLSVFVWARSFFNRLLGLSFFGLLRVLPTFSLDHLRPIRCVALVYVLSPVKDLSSRALCLSWERKRALWCSVHCFQLCYQKLITFTSHIADHPGITEWTLSIV